MSEHSVVRWWQRKIIAEQDERLRTDRMVGRYLVVAFGAWMVTASVGWVLIALCFWNFVEGILTILDVGGMWREWWRKV
jgi:hypothetical protein